MIRTISSSASAMPSPTTWLRPARRVAPRLIGTPWRPPPPPASSIPIPAAPSWTDVVARGQPVHRRRRGLINSVLGGATDVVQAVANEVAPGVVGAVDIDGVVQRVDIQGVVDRVDIDAVVERIDIDAVVARIDIDAVVDRIDMQAILDKVDLQSLVARIDLDAALRDVDL